MAETIRHATTTSTYPKYNKTKHYIKKGSQTIATWSEKTKKK
ncbi:hypothetical protein K040078D81_03160 [Blautia hominis]|uniref:Uncharacterized protein n=1 Tax=Blautia hominis TaxID=2025493 RepID=A0ABQ0B417_9FIRM